MASRLSSMLVRDGIVGVKRLEKAFRRQVVYGGNLDTVLLEMGLIAEERLCQYLALSSGLPPASRAELPAESLESVRSLLPEALAGKHRIVPLGIEDDAIRVAVHAPVDMTLLEDLADAIDRALQPLIVPEYRWHVWFGRVYGGIPLERFIVLAAELDAYAEVQPVGRAQTVIVAEEPKPPSDMATAPLPPTLPAEPTNAPIHTTLRMEIQPEATPEYAAPSPSDRNSNRRITLIGLEPARAQTAEPVPADFKPTVEDPPYRDTLPPEDVNLTPYVPGTDVAPGLAGFDASQFPSVVDPYATLPLPPPMKRPALAGTAAPPARRITAAPPLAATAAVLAAPSAAATGTAVAVPRAITPGERASGPRIAYSELASDRLPTEPMPLEEQPASNAAALSRATSAVPIAPIGNTLSGSARASTANPFDEKLLNASPLSPLAAKQLLLSAEDRDAVFVTLLRAARYRTRFAGLLTVQGGAAIGRIGIAEPSLDAKSFSTVLVPLDMASPFRTAFTTRQPQIGPLRGNDDALDLMLRRMGGTIPATALVMPITVRDRVVALMVAHRGERELTLSDVADVVSLDRLVTEALTRVIRRMKGASADDSAATVSDRAATVDMPSQSASEAAPAAVRATSAIPVVRSGDTRASTNAETRSLRAPTVRSMDAIEFGTEVSITADEPRTIDEILDDVMGNNPGLVDDAMMEAIERAGAMLPLLNMRFPGRLRVDRFSVSGRPLRAAQYGGLLELLVRMGPDATELLIQKMSAPQRDIRFYATVCCVELRPKAAVNGLVERLFDNDFGVRACAIEALGGYPLKDLETALVHTRHALHSDDIDRVAAASHATAEIADVGAMPDLLAAMARGGRYADHARNAMLWLTRQDFGTSERKWRRWWEDNRRRHRIEWLIDALGHKEEALRKAAIEDLRRLTGEYFGYHHDLGKRERDAAEARWLTWWKETGARRFA